MNTNTEQKSPPVTSARTGLAEIGENKLRALCEQLGSTPAQAALAQQTFRNLTQPWLNQVPADAPAWPSDITDDHSPFEFSVSFGKNGRDVRILVEAQDGRMEEHQGWEPAVLLTRRLAGQPGVNLARFEQIQDLFAPDARVRARFALWHAAAVPAEGPTLYKVYLNPQVLGSAGAPDLVREAFARLGMLEAWPFVEDLLRLPAERNEILYIALDLSDTADARVKVYVAHHGVRTAALESHLRRIPSYQAGEATRLTRELADSDGPFVERPVLTCLGFVAGRPAPEVTLHLPVRCYAGHDGQVVERLAASVGGQAGADLAAAIAAFAGRKLDAGRGLITYVSLRGARDGTRVVAYLSPEVYRTEPPRPEAGGATMLDVMQEQQAHERFERDVQRTLAGVSLSAERLAGVCATVDRTFAQMVALADDLVAQLANGREKPQAARTSQPERMRERHENLV
jgi:DMATS type aromatic prenyltransferase